MTIQSKIEQQIADNPVLIYIKGTADAPACGFSARVISILQEYEVKFTAINVLDDAELRQAIKEYSNWPTIPQIYIKQQFIGGGDILADLHANGELQHLLQDLCL